MVNFGEIGRFHAIPQDEDQDGECKVPARKASFRIEEELMRYRRVLGGHRISLPNDGLQRSCAHKSSKWEP